MSIWQDIGKRVTDTTNKAVQMVKEYTDVSKLNAELSSEKKHADEAYAELGRQYMAKNGTAPDPAFNQTIQKIRIAEGKIAQYQSEIDRITAATRCPSCGAHIDEGAAFCSSCGHKLK